MKFSEFEELAWRYWDEIPETYKDGVDGLVIERDALPHPTLPEIYTLGECVTEAYPSGFGGPDTIRSYVLLYYGSFWRLSRQSPDFDWEDELWETLTHELQHHLESLAEEDALIAMDYANDENFKRLDGEPFDPFFYRSGEEVAEGVWRVERDVFFEQRYPASREPGAEVEIVWHGEPYRLARPAELGDVCFVHIEEGLDTGAGGEVYLVLVRERGLGASLRALFGGASPTIVEAAARAEPVRAKGSAPGTDKDGA